MNIKKIAAITISSCMFLTSSISVLAAPKQMADGTMFDAQFYAQTYPDIANALGTDEAALYNHYVQFGKAEGRKATADSTGTVAAQPVAQTGRSVFYKLSKEEMEDILYDVFSLGNGDGVWFDEVTYAQMYPDIAAKVGTSHNVLWKHYKTKGIYEGRQAAVKDIYSAPSWNDISKKNVMILNAVATLVNENTSERDICKIAHDWVCGHLTYGEIPAGNNSYRGGVHLGVGKCGDYSYTFAQFVKWSGLLVNIKSYPGNPGHGWNEVWVDGHRYEVDCTYDDQNDNITYNYFLIENAH